MIRNGFGQQRSCWVANRITAGQHRLNDLVLNEPAVSRFHFMIVSDPELHLFYLIDMHSLNGTWLNGRLVTRMEVLRDGDRIQIGKTLRLDVQLNS